MSAQKIMYVVTQSPYSNSAGQEALDALLIGAAFEQEVSVLFIHNGVFQLKNQQSTAHESSEISSIKQFTKTYKALEDFGVENVYVDSLSMASRGLDESQLMMSVTLLDSEQVSSLLAQQFRVFTF